MKIERKENSGLIEFGSLKCGDVFAYQAYICMKVTKRNCDSPNLIYLEDGDEALIGNETLVKHYPNAKLVLED